ncbi:hypothetical protein [Kitasatospora cheerisanensis]|uniref:hypothetical protein n=1 Tax=Kitasatospora cheerisanensis TaxID=81942 RepID=UPI0012ED80EB|nr:hypothetical protein [Kitasatospora cheerisanensis]
MDALEQVEQGGEAAEGVGDAQAGLVGDGVGGLADGAGVAAAEFGEDGGRGAGVLGSVEGLGGFQPGVGLVVECEAALVGEPAELLTGALAGLAVRRGRGLGRGVVGVVQGAHCHVKSGSWRGGGQGGGWGGCGGGGVAGGQNTGARSTLART